MNNKMLSSIVGLFSVLSTIQFLIFDVNQISYIGSDNRYNIYLETRSWSFLEFMAHRKAISIGLSIITIIISISLLYCLHVNHYIGLLCYALWIIVYEFTNFALVLLIIGSIRDLFRELSYLLLFFQISRMLLHFLFLPFVFKYAYQLYNECKTTIQIGRRKRSSSSIVDQWTPVGPRTLYRKSN
ncbi:putative transmembrane protein 217B [Erinaceus europaeus]|uniref:Transmembrane protein 217B n=1 Tax=Erinaceus europaeus TaxID=9365 RepID=A0ABM3XA71_ERIEU|nr:putative transmembrane protein 217B [Erinaceus europaeus]